MIPLSTVLIAMHYYRMTRSHFSHFAAATLRYLEATCGAAADLARCSTTWTLAHAAAGLASRGGLHRSAYARKI